MSFLGRWMWGAMRWLGLYQMRGTVVFLGLDSAGKTTLMRLLSEDRVMQHMPTQKPTMEEFTLGQLSLRVFDLGGHAIARRLWREYTVDADGIVFLVDTQDRERLPDAARELQEMLATEALADTPFLVLGTKIDLPGAMSVDELRFGLGLAGLQSMQPLEVFMCSLIRRQGYKEGLEWLAEQLDK